MRFKRISKIGAWRSWLAHSLGVGEAAGSNPVAPILQKLVVDGVTAGFFVCKFLLFSVVFCFCGLKMD